MAVAGLVEKQQGGGRAVGGACRWPGNGAADEAALALDKNGAGVREGGDALLKRAVGGEEPAEGTPEDLGFLAGKDAQLPISTPGAAFVQQGRPVFEASAEHRR